ncbi:MAG TPA: hypothetical protein VEI02_08580 [Planctomycetota bacterium]|nr:hypothetical protein [Planctomycetota bacterium]
MKLFRPHAPPDLPVDAPERLAELSDLVQAAEDAVEEIRRDGLDRKAHAFVDEIFAQGMARRIRIGAATGTWEEFERAAASRPWGERRVVLMTPDDGDEALEVVLRPSEHAGWRAALEEHERAIAPVLRKLRGDVERLTR